MESLKLIAVKDLKAGFFNTPNFQRNLVDAMRQWSTICNEPGNTLSQFPHDFRLYCLGEFDIKTGRLTMFEDPQDLGSAADVRKPSEPHL